MSGHSPSPDHEVRRLREEIAEVDRAIVAAVNARIDLVARLRSYKASQGIPFLDPDRERQLLDELTAANGGPLSEEGLRQLFAEVLDLTKREVSGSSSP